jgi:membrane protease YdiL (CAAX protease family)
VGKKAVAVRVGLFVILAVLGLQIFPLIINFILGPGGYVITAALGTFAAAAVANAISLRVYERGRLADIGLDWNADSRRNLSLGILGGIGAAFVVLILPILTQQAEVQVEPNAKPQWASLAFVTVVLLFGAVGEEMLFRGYAFQVLVRAFGPFATILPWAVLFGVAHMNNRNVVPLGVVNTVLWGIVLGFAFIRSGDLWLPIGLHFGWNWTLPLLGVNLSGFTIDLTGLALHWKASEIFSGGAYGPEGGVFTTGIVAALFVYLFRAPIRTQEAFLLREKPEDVPSS